MLARTNYFVQKLVEMQKCTFPPINIETANIDYFAEIKEL